MSKRDLSTYPCLRARLRRLQADFGSGAPYSAAAELVDRTAQHAHDVAHPVPAWAARIAEYHRDGVWRLVEARP